MRHDYEYDIDSDDIILPDGSVAYFEDLHDDEYPDECVVLFEESRPTAVLGRHAIIRLKSGATITLGESAEVVIDGVYLDVAEHIKDKVRQSQANHIQERNHEGLTA